METSVLQGSQSRGAALPKISSDICFPRIPWPAGPSAGPQRVQCHPSLLENFTKGARPSDRVVLAFRNRPIMDQLAIDWCGKGRATQWPPPYSAAEKVRFQSHSLRHNLNDTSEH